VTTKQQLAELANAVVDRLHGAALVERALTTEAPTGPVTLWAVGKAACAMALGARAALGDRLTGGLIIGGDDRLRCAGLPVLTGGHPIPDARSAVAGEALLAAARATRPGQEIVLCLSGGASALAAAPAPGVRLDELRDRTRQLLASGAHIADINAARRRLTALGGGKLAAATRGRLSVLGLSDIILPSDVDGDDDDQVWAALGSGPAFAEAATAPPRRLLATPRTLRDHAVAAIDQRGWIATAEPLFCATVDELADQLVAKEPTLTAASVVVIVGEPRVHLAADHGQGGRAQQLALLVAARLGGRPFALVAVGSDGRDGPTDAAGAAVDGHTTAEAAAAGLDLALAARRCDSHPTLRALGCTLPRRETGTNVCDLYLLARTT